MFLSWLRGWLRWEPNFAALQRVKGRNFSVGQLGPPFGSPNGQFNGEQTLVPAASILANLGCLSQCLSAASEAVTTVWDNATVPAFPVEFEGRKNVLPNFSAQFHPPVYQFGSFWGRKTWSKKRATRREPLDGLILQL